MYFKKDHGIKDYKCAKSMIMTAIGEGNVPKNSVYFFFCVVFLE